MTIDDPFSQELLSVQERSITGDHVAFSSLEQNIPGFSLILAGMSDLAVPNLAQVNRVGEQSV